jgi:hypothetical protein
LELTAVPGGGWHCTQESQDGDNDSLAEGSVDRLSTMSGAGKEGDHGDTDPWAKYIRAVPDGAASGEYAQGEWWK